MGSCGARSSKSSTRLSHGPSCGWGGWGGGGGSFYLYSQLKLENSNLTCTLQSPLFASYNNYVYLLHIIRYTESELQIFRVQLSHIT